MGHRSHGYGDRYDHRESDHDHHDRHREHSDLFLLRTLLRGRHRKKILIAAVAAVLLLIVVAITALVFLWPLFSGALDYVEKNGVQGAVNEGSTFLKSLWTGNGGSVEPAPAR